MVETDASGKGIGAVMCQNGHPIAYWSKTLSAKHQALSTYEKEFLAVVVVLDKWKGYLLDRHFKIRTVSLKYLLNQKLTTPFQFKWLPKLLGYDYEIVYKKGSENVVADALSRMDSSGEFLQISISSVSSGVWDKHFYDEAIGGHSGAHVTMKKLGSLFYWKGLKKMVKQMVKDYDVCQRQKPDLSAYPGLIQPLPIPERIWKEISMDFIEKLPTSYGKSMIMLHGLPESVVSDRDKVFLSNFWKALFAELKVKLKLSTAYHPQTDGQTEVVNRSLGCYLRCMCREKPKELIKWLPLAEFCRVEEVDGTLQAREEAIKMFKFHLKRQVSIRQGQQHKLSSKYYGPFKVAERIREVAYRLELPSSIQIHPVFHISQLKKCHGKDHSVGVLPQLREDGLLENKPMAILERRLGKVNNKPFMFVLIQWTNKPVEEVTWEIYGDLITRFLGFDAVNEVLDKLEEWYNSYLSKIASGSNEKPKMVYPYRRVITGFAAKISNEQAKVMENLDGVLFVSLEKRYKLHTTHSPRFLGLHQNKGVWRAHSSSTATGNYVNNASVFEQANGTASGMAPLAHLAMYKVCATFGCLASDIFVGTDTTIEDGADVISLSLGGPPLAFYNDSIAIGAFTAIKSGIFVSCSAGNSGPSNETLSNGAPWILTVGASKTDRRIRTTVSLGNKKILNGEALYQPKNYKPKVRPLVYPAGMGYSCTSEELKLIDVKGKIVLCDVNYILMESAMGEAVKEAWGAAMIIVNDKLTGNSVAVEVQVLPLSHVGYREGVAIKKYLNSTSAPVATIIQRGTVLGVKSAPQVTVFSSRGPSHASPGILKQDIFGPGVDILAAWHKSVDNNIGTQATFNNISGTSMSCPHLTGVVALIKSTHPDRSPAAIKSAIMTIASNVRLNGHFILDEDHPADIFTFGLGHVEVSKSNDPGLILCWNMSKYKLYMS
ncbi:peptidase S8/S53 domain-containing protein [Tanacetum coccineum]